MFNITDKRKNCIIQMEYLFAKTTSMFEWASLPETIPPYELERLLQRSGYAFITEVQGELYAFNGGLGGEVDVYGNPTQINISNPALGFHKTLDIEGDGILISNDSYRLGLTPLFQRYSHLINENTINMHLFGIQSRMRNVLGATDDRTKESAELYLERINQGVLSVIGESALFDGLKNHSASVSNGSIVELIEYHQYIKAELYEEIGLNLSFNMKRERLNEAEVGLSEDILFPYVDNMAMNRMKGVLELNEKYGLTVDVDFGSTWNRKRKDTVDNVIDGSSEIIDDSPGQMELDELMKEAEEINDIMEGNSDEIEDDNLDNSDVESSDSIPDSLFSNSGRGIRSLSEVNIEDDVEELEPVESEDVEELEPVESEVVELEDVEELEPVESEVVELEDVEVMLDSTNVENVHKELLESLTPEQISAILSLVKVDSPSE